MRSLRSLHNTRFPNLKSLWSPKRRVSLATGPEKEHVTMEDVPSSVAEVGPSLPVGNETQALDPDAQLQL